MNLAGKNREKFKKITEKYLLKNIINFGGNFFLPSSGSCENALTVLIFEIASVAIALASDKNAQICLLIFLEKKIIINKK